MNDGFFHFLLWMTMEQPQVLYDDSEDVRPEEQIVVKFFGESGKELHYCMSIEQAKELYFQIRDVVFKLEG